MGGNWSAERGVKRPHEDVDDTSETSEGDVSDNEHTPKRKRFQSTSQYIVRKLFEEGIDSDVTIQALGKSWCLHKIYLSQCKYFDSMFSGQWAESDQSDIHIEISDENITAEALRIALKSLYTDNILLKPIQAVGVLAAATFLQLEPLIEHCRIVMKGCITRKTVCSYHAASERYGLLDIKKNCMSWLQHCLMLPQNASMLSEISEELLLNLLDSKDLWLMQVEVDIYSLLKKWTFTQLNPTWNESTEQLYSDTSDFFKRKAQDSEHCFLETEEGHRFIHVFKKVRWMYLINDASCIQTVKDDHIVPENWLDPVFKFCWIQHLRTEQGLDCGPEDVSDEDFYKWSMRCGRLLIHEQDYHWRWLGYSYGLDLLFTLRHRVLTVNRNIGSTQHFPGSLTQQETRRVMLCVRMTQMKKTFSVKSSGIKTLSLHNDNAEQFVLTLDPGCKFPMQVTMHLLYLSPDTSQPCPSLHTPSPPLAVVPSPPPAPSSSSTSSDSGSSGQGESGDHGSGSHGQSKRMESGGGSGDRLDGADVATQTEEPVVVVSRTESSVPGCSSSGSRILKQSGFSQTASERSLATQSSLSSSVSEVPRNNGPGLSMDRPRASTSATVSGSSSFVSSIVLPSAGSSAYGLLPDTTPSSSSPLTAAFGSSVTLQSSSARVPSAFVTLPACVMTPSTSGVSSSQSHIADERKNVRRSTRMRSHSRNCLK